VTNAIGLIDDSGRGGGLYTVLSTQGGPQVPDTAKKEFINKVKTITCMYDGDLKRSPLVELKQDNLIFRVRGDDPKSPGIGHGPDWIIRDFKKIFPEFKKTYVQFFEKK
jgi:hypothetical protein